MAETVRPIYQVFTLPGEWILSVIERFAPRTVEILLVDHGAIIVPFVLSLLAWTLFIVAGLLFTRMCRNLAWQVAALWRTFVWRIRMGLGSLKTRLLWKYRQFFPHRGDNSSMVSREEFDNVDVAVLRRLFKQGPDMTISAPELTEQLKLRPAQIQHRLENLVHHQMVRSVIGSTDGYENYRLTDSGLAFITMLQRQARVTPSVSPVSASGPG